jgi:hypothetical protein
VQLCEEVLAITCPTCETPVSLPAGGVAKLPVRGFLLFDQIVFRVESRLKAATQGKKKKKKKRSMMTTAISCLLTPTSPTLPLSLAV